ncbi:MAG TPA: FAD-binding and (Fe-S)-binding domain-containing protein [Terriglobia bacterium]|nr:FAD-binding and (Fe-S)-binding domain-containing protein [Terriglobia bacterium]
MQAIIGNDAKALAAELRDKVRGEVRFDDGSRALYATDSSNYRQVPIGVVVPKGIEDVVETVATCRRHDAPVLTRGGGTSLAGQCCNVAVVVDMSKSLRGILELDPHRRLATVQPGVVLDTLRSAAERYHLTFAPDPSTHAQCTLGGMIGNNSCGVHSIMAGKTVDNVQSLEILTYDGACMQVGRTEEAEIDQIVRHGGRRGQIYERLRSLRDRYADLIRARYPAIPRRVSGYNLDQLLPENGFNVARALVGTEGTCVTVLSAELRLVDSPPARSLLVLGYSDVATAADHVPEILAARPIGLEGIAGSVVENMMRRRMRLEDIALLPAGGAWLMVEFGARTTEEADDQARALLEDLKKRDPATTGPAARLFNDRRLAKRVWEMREIALSVASETPNGNRAWAGWEDAAVAPAVLGNYLRDFDRLQNSYGYQSALYGHFGDGCIHARLDFDLLSRPGIEKFRAFMIDAADLVVRHGGSLSGEHGDGQARAELLPRMFGEELVAAFQEFKAIWDPDGRMNPGKLVDARHLNRMDENLRLGVDYSPKRPATHFKFPDDRGGFADAALRCVGVSKCRREVGGTMCPSYMVTHDEQHSTRGRARLLFEMLNGGVVADGWRNESVKEALDLCLACKGCKQECPAAVDMATYKAEFLSHYYEGRVRPRSAYAVGWIHRWARLGTMAPELANFFTQAPVLSSITKSLAGIAPGRQIPRLAPKAFRQLFGRRFAKARQGAAGTNPGQPRVMLWPDTFNNYFSPETAMAAVKVLVAAGYSVELPAETVCCGRPLYDYGMLDEAAHLLRRVLRVLRWPLAAGVPIVVLEPSCAAVFRDESLNLFPGDEDASRLSKQTFLLSEFLARYAPAWQPPRLGHKAIVHGHCHHKAVMGLEDEQQVLAKLGLDFNTLDSGCCGMAGGFGFEKEHYEISLRIGERVLLPAVRNAAPDTLIVADGFSCREQILQTTGRRALHLAEVLEKAVRMVNSE